MAIESLLDESAPWHVIKAVAKRTPANRIFKILDGVREHELSGITQVFEVIHELSTELGGKDSNWNEEVLFITRNIPAAEIKARACDNSMNMRMIIELLPPCVQDLDNTGNTAKEFSVGCQLKDRLRSTFVQQTVKESLIGVKQRIQFGRHSKDEMIIGSIDDF